MKIQANKHIITSKYTLGYLLVIIPTLILIVYIAAVSARNTDNQPNSSRPLEVSQSGLENRPNRGQGVIVRTTNASKLAAYAREEGLNVSNKINLPNNRSLVVLDSGIRDIALDRMSKKASAIILGDIYPNHAYTATSTPNDTHYSEQWNFSRISTPYAWNINKGSSDVTIAVLDTGILSSQSWGDSGPYTHPDFPSSKMWTNPGEIGSTTEEGAAPNCTSRGLELDKKCNNLDDDASGLIDDWHGWDFMGGWRGDSNICPNYSDSTLYNNINFPGYVYQDNDPQPYSCDDYTDQNMVNKNHFSTGCGYSEGACFVGHGTSVASVAAAATDNEAGVAGVDWNAKLMSLRVLDGYGGGDSAATAAAIEYATAQGADVINMSLALFTDGSCVNTDVVVEDALEQAANAGVVIVAASGNGANRGVCYPARSPFVIAVGSSDKSDKRSDFSTYGPELDVLAPGSNIPAANAPSVAANVTYRSNTNGTSLSTPHVAGQAAILKALYPLDSRSATINRIKDTADKLPDMNGRSFTEQHGYGRINVFASMTNMGNRIPVYRLYNRDRNYHFYTTSANERDTAVSVHDFRYEGIRFYARNTSNGTQPIYRLYRPATRSHLFTTSTIERDRAVKQNDFRYEGVGLRVFDGEDSYTKPIYRLYRPSTGSHFYTESLSERDNAVREHGFRYEGVGFRAE